jgi:DHA3 family tetracycline resistance protein-like MFS transporter
MRRFSATAVYLFIEFGGSALFSMAFVVMSLYEATVAGLTPLQLVLVGTTVELSIFLFEVPTGVVADIYSRRLSIIVGYLLIGGGFLIEGLFPAFVPILIAQVVWGLGYTFTSGATEAWISDEIGEAPANKLFLRATRLGLLGALLGMGVAIVAGAQKVALPILVSGLGIALLGVVLAVFMPETGFHPAAKEQRNTWQHMWHTFRQGIAAVRSRPRLVTILGVGLFYGLYSEGFDRLWVKHLLVTFELPALFGGTDVAFFGLLRVGSMLLSMLATRVVEKRLDGSKPEAVGSAMLGITAVLAAAIVGFALSPVLGLTIAIYWVISVLRNVHSPLFTAWVNQRLDPKVRATVLSMSGQVDAIGQIAGGPGVGMIARLGSVVAAITTSGLLLTPALWLTRAANAISAQEAQAPPDSPEAGNIAGNK